MGIAIRCLALLSECLRLNLELLYHTWLDTSIHTEMIHLDHHLADSMACYLLPGHRPSASGTFECIVCSQRCDTPQVIEFFVWNDGYHAIVGKGTKEILD